MRIRMRDMYILDSSGNPVAEDDAMAWAMWFEKSPDVRRVARTQVTPLVEVSTVFLGCGSPLLYETMIFGGPHNEWQDRYSTRDEAVRGHERACAIARGDVPLESE